MPMMKIAAVASMPNQRMANGTQARPGIGRSTRMTHASEASSVSDMPVATPRPTPSVQPITSPAR